VGGWVGVCVGGPPFSNSKDDIACVMEVVHLPMFVFLSVVRIIALSALTLLVGHREGHLACKDRVMRCWRDYLSGARCR